MNKRIFGNEVKYVLEVLHSEFRSSKAVNMVSRAEGAFADFIGTEFAIGFVNGTATLHTALEVLEVGPGDEVIVPPLTMSATAFSVLQAGATPVFADVDPETFQINPQSIKSVMSDNTKAIITVALYGGSPDYQNILEVIGDIPLIEDNAEAFGTTYHGKNLGTFGQFASYSFQSSKHLTSGEGGMLVTNVDGDADRARKIQSLGYRGVSAKFGKISKKDIQNPNYLRHEILGWNYRLSDLCAAVILGQIEVANKLIARRVHVANQIDSICRNTKWLKKQSVYENSTHSFWAFPVLLENSEISWQEFRDKFVENGGKGIYAAWALSYLEPVFLEKKFLGRDKFINKQQLARYAPGLCPNAEALQPKILAFRTNEWDDKNLEIQLDALYRTIDFFD